MASSSDPTAPSSSPPASRGADGLDERELLRRLERADEQLRQKDRELEQFLHTVSHDLKSPLVTIVGFLDLLAQDLDAGRSEQNLEVLGRIRRAGLHMSKLIDGLLQLSRIGSGRLHPDWVDVPELVHELLGTTLADALEAHPARVVVQSDMPPAFADRERLAQVFEHLIQNALEHGQADTQRPIEVGGEAFADETRYFVRDAGPGVPHEHHQRIFDPFQALGRVSPRRSGLGLAIVSRILTAHRGRAWIESTPGSGASFWIAIPHEPPGGGRHPR